jgi:hypothetical protein
MSALVCRLSADFVERYSGLIGRLSVAIPETAGTAASSKDKGVMRQGDGHATLEAFSVPGPTVYSWSIANMTVAEF